jgi:serine protease inhibitor
MKKLNIILLITVILSIISCEKRPGEPSDSPFHITKTTEELIAADNQFGLDLFKQVAALEGNDTNIFISPFSVSMALAMTYNGARSTTKEAMEKTLNKEGFTTEEINEIYENLMNGLISVDPKVVLEIANSIWYKEGYPVEQEFINANMTYYDAEVREIDFGLPNAKDIINGWVAEKTHDKIKEIIDIIPRDIIMYLINAIYFNGTWKYEFDITETVNDDFYLNDGSSIPVPTMMQQEHFNYYKNDIFSAAELPYGDGNYSMVILLPENNKSVNDVIAELNSENWNTWSGSFSEKEMIIHLPKFKFKYFNLLNQALKNLGMGIAFTFDADFSGINPDRDLAISRVLHKAFVDVNEEGTEAAAVTAVEIIRNVSEGPEDEIIRFYVNRPFLFVIKEKDTNAIIFIGRVMKPEYNE